MKPRFALLLPSLAHGGAQKIFLECAEYLQSSHENVIMIVLDQDGELLKNVPNELDIKFLDYGIKYNGLWKRLIQFFRLRKAVKEYGATDILSTVTGMNIFTLSCFYFSKDLGITIREPSSLENISSKIVLVLIKLFYSRADRIICTSKYGCEQLINLDKKLSRKAIFLPNPIDTCKIRHLSKARYDVPWGDHSHKIISVGRLVKAKGYDVLIRAMSDVSEKLDCQLVIVGEGPERKSLEKLIKGLALGDCVKLIGYKNNPYPYLASADLFVLSSRWEGYVNTVLEAMVLGVDIVATDCKSGPGDLLKKKLGYNLVPVESQKELASSICQSLIAKRDTKLFEGLLKDHSIDVAVRNYINK